MYVPPAFREDDLSTLQGVIREARLANLVTATAEGLVATPLPLFLVPDEGSHGTLYGHLAAIIHQPGALPCRVRRFSRDGCAGVRIRGHVGSGLLSARYGGVGGW